jgi:photosystem II stability/assembly factor-like uncharacterized protein
MLLPAPPPFIQSVQMVDASVGYAVGGKQTATVFELFRTRDGGRTWTNVTPRGVHPTGPPAAYGRTVFFGAPSRGAIVVERSHDEGRTWRRSLPLRDARVAEAGPVVRLDARRLFLALGEGAAAGSSAQSIWRSDDGGRSWRFVSRTDATGRRAGALPFSCDKAGVGFATRSRGWAGGACAGGPAFLYRTDDGGRTWRLQRLGGLARCGCETSAPRFFGTRDGGFSVVGFTTNGGGKPVARVYWTSDGGAHWRATVPPVGRAGQVSFVDGRTAWLVGTARGVIGSPFDRLVRTTDAGRHWRNVKLPFDAQNYRLDAVSATVAFAVGQARAALLRTTDGGRTWRSVR